MSKKVHEGEQDRERLLHAHEPVERPFAMVLNDRLQHRRIAIDPLIGNYMLAGIVAVRGACPEKETEVKSWVMVSRRLMPGYPSQTYVVQSRPIDSSPQCIPEKVKISDERQK